jgi:uncharacterized protein YaiI (UPF0178 family)
MHIWVDADACPIGVKEILYRAAIRVQRQLTLVANRSLRVPPSPLIRSVQVSGGIDAADDYIAERVQPGDLLITADIPLAARAVEKEAHVISPRGEPFTRENIRERLSLRDFMETMRDLGEATGGPEPLNKSDLQAFANHLDRLLRRT